MSSRAIDEPARAAGSAISETWLPRGEFVTQLLESGVGEAVRYQAGHHLYKQGEVDRHFYILVSGKVYVSNLSADGHESTFNVMGPGSVIGEAAALIGLPRHSTARLLEQSELIKLQATDLEQYVRQAPRFAVALIHALSLKQRMAVERLHQAVFEAPHQRILCLLEQVAEIHADKHEDGDAAALRVQLTHEQIGNLTNLSRVTVSRTLQDLKRAGRVDLTHRAVMLSNRTPRKSS